MNEEPTSACPYQVGGALPADSLTYIERQADQDLYEKLKVGDFCYVLDPRQTGKSSLMVRIKNRLEAEGIACSAIDLTMISNDEGTQEEWYNSIIKCLSKTSSFHLSGFNYKTWISDRKSILAVHRLSEFIQEELLRAVSQKIVIFLDEIDSVLSLKKFSCDDFFALIRSCYNQRSINPEYKRLTFALLGVATPFELMKDKERTPFNIGQRIQLNSFELKEVEPLAQGLKEKVSKPQAVLEEVLRWTGGQPFLTQKLCELVFKGPRVPTGDEAKCVKDLVKSRIINNWEKQDPQQHLRTIRDRLMWEDVVGRLGMYEDILKYGNVDINNITTPYEFLHKFLLTGLVVEEQEKLKVFNTIYKFVFNKDWLDKELKKVRPYHNKFVPWLNSNDDISKRDRSKLLKGKELKDAKDWASSQILSKEDFNFLQASRDLENREQKKRIWIGAALLLSLLGTVTVSSYRSGLFKSGVIDADKSLGQFDSGEIEALLSAVKAGQDLKLNPLLRYSSLWQNYSVSKVLVALHTILNKIHERNRLNGFQGTVWSVSFSPDGKYLATAGEDGTVRLWNLSGKRLDYKSTAHQVGRLLSVSFSPNSQMLAAAGEGGRVELWNLKGDHLEHSETWKTPQGRVREVSFSPDGKYLATAGEDGTVQLWNLSGKQLLKYDPVQPSDWSRIFIPDEPPLSLSFSPDGKYLATAGEDGTVRLWNLKSNQFTKFDTHKGKVLSVSFSPDGSRLATAGNDGTVRLWDLSGKQLAQLTGHYSSVLSVSFSRDGNYLATGGYDGTARLWDLSDKKLAVVKQVALFVTHQGSVRSVRLSFNGKLLATAGYDGTTRLWDWSDKQLFKFNTYHGKVNSISSSPDGKLLATGGDDNKARLWNLSNKPLLSSCQGHSNKVWSVSFSSRDSKYLATGGYDGTARLWDSSCHFKLRFPADKHWIWSVSLSPDGNHLATVGDEGIVKLWNLMTGRQEEQFEPKAKDRVKLLSVSFSPNSQMLAAAGEVGTVRLWDLKGQQLAEFQGHQGSVLSVSFSPDPDSNRLATAGDDGTARLWNLSGDQIARFDGHSSRVRKVIFSPDGKFLATAGEDDTARLWNPSGDQIARFDTNQNGVRDVSFSPKGKLLFTAGENGTVKLWPVEGLNEQGLDELLAQSCDWLKDYLTTNRQKSENLEVCQNSSISNSILIAAATARVERGEELARGGNVEGAVAQFRKALQWNPNLNFDPETKARQLAAPAPGHL